MTLHQPTPKTGIVEIAPYVPGRRPSSPAAAKLSSNENPLGCSPAASAAYRAAEGELNRYPDSRTSLLRAAIAERFALAPDRLLFGCGSDELFGLICQTFLEPGDNVVQGRYGFASYGIAARACQAEVRYAPEPGYRIDVDAMLAAVDARTRIVFVANPANPTGTVIGGDELRRLHAGLPQNVLLLLDCAYAEFVDGADYEDGLQLARDAENVVATRTFSKIHGLAALRIGWAYAAAPVIAAVDRIRPPFNINIPGQQAAVAALADAAFQARSREHVSRWRPRFAAGFEDAGFEVVDGAANFLLFGCPPEGPSAEAIERRLDAEGFVIRGLRNYGLDRHLRISYGTDAENQALVEALGRIAAEP